MDLILGGNTLRLPAFPPRFRRQIIRLHEAFLAGGTLDIEQFNEAAEHWLSQQPDDSKDDEYFNAFSIIWQHYLGRGQFGMSERVWQLALEPALNVEQATPGRHVHKGTAFYFWGMTALLAGNLDKGYALMHQAVEEDVRRSGGTWPATPSTALATLDSEEEKQAFGVWVLRQAELLEEYLEAYRTTYSTALTLPDLRAKILTDPSLRDATFSLSYVLARLLKLKEIPLYARDNAFTSQWELNVLFDLALVIDVILKPKSAERYFHGHAVYLANRAGLGVTGNQLGDANKAANTDFAATITTLIDELASVLPDGTTVLRGLQRDLTIAYLLRNLGGHALPSLPVLRLKRDQIEQSVFNTLFLAVEKCY